MRMDGHNFIVGGGSSTDERGKCHWPDSITISIPKRKVLPLIEQLARSLALGQDDVHVNFMGKLEYKNESVVDV